MPNIQRTEVGAVGVGVADALQDRDLPLVVHIFYRGHGRVEPNLVIDGQDVFRRDIHHRPVVHVMGVAIGDEGIQGVIGPRHLKNYQHRVFLVGGHRFSLPKCVVVPKPTGGQESDAEFVG